MRPTLRQLQYLVAVAETGRFSEAAKRVNVSQPSLSAQVARMEEELGVTLFERATCGALLTPKGADILARARAILRDVEDLRASARQESEDLEGLVRLGVLPTIGPYLLPLATRQLHARFPQLRFSVREERTMDLKAHLHSGEYDTIISMTDDMAGTSSLPLFEEKLWICIAPDDPLATCHTPIGPAHLEGRELLSLGHWQNLNLRVQALANTAGAHVNTEYAGTSLDSLRQMAEMGTGVAILPSLYALSEMRRDPHLIIRRIDYPQASRTISLIWRDSSPISGKLETLSDVLKNAAIELLDESCLPDKPATRLSPAD